MVLLLVQRLPNLMKMKFHSKTFDLLKVRPAFSQKNAGLVREFEKTHQIKLPPSLNEWFSLENHLEILQELLNVTLNHSLINVQGNIDCEAWIKKLTPDYRDFFFIVLEENQACFHMAVELLDVSDPPVLIRFNDQDAVWKLHSHTFSDWIYAIAWDSLNVKNVLRPPKESDLKDLILNLTEKGPETFHANMWLYASRFVRGVHNGQRKTFILE